MLSPLDVAIVLAYVAGILAVGVWVYGRVGGFRDYFVAGNHMTAPVLVCTLVSTYYGLDVLFGGGEVGYIDGVVAFFYYTRPYYLAVLIAALLVARKLKQHDFLSLPDVVAHYYGRGTQVVVTAASFFYSLPLLAVMGLGILLDATLGIPFVWGVFLGAGVALVYTLLGGLLADALTDTVQFTLMCVTLGLAAAFLMRGGMDMAALRQALPASYFEPMGTYPPWVLAVFGLAALSVLVEPAFYQRIFAATSYRAVLVALAMGIVLWAAFDWVVTLLGMAAAASGIETEPRYALLTITLEVLPTGLRGLFVAGAVATAMSTIDSYLLIAGGNLAYDLYRPLVRPDMSDRAVLRLTRWMIVFSAGLSMLFALFFQSMVSAWIFMSTILIAAALVPVLAGLYLPGRPKPAAGLASSLGGLMAALVWVGLTQTQGVFSEEWGTRIWTVELGGVAVPLWREYAVLAALPVSCVGFSLGQWLGAAPADRPAPAGTEARP